jgi:hypothetical protein
MVGRLAGENDLASTWKEAAVTYLCGALPDFGIKRTCSQQQQKNENLSVLRLHSGVIENSCFWDDAPTVGMWTAMSVSNMSP